ncbi:MAG: hypothetical protein AAFP69_06145, partial [Planctomycetota bacterium]
RCLQAMKDDLGALAAYRAAALRRAAPATLDIRIAALRAAVTLAEKLSLNETLGRYKEQLRLALQQQRDAQSGD